MDIIIDIETLSTKNNAHILTIAGIKFNPYTPHTEIKELKEMDTFYCRIEPNSCKQLGMHIEDKTVTWWQSQSDEAKYEAFEHPKRIPIKKALIKFNKWFGDNDRTFLWSRGNNFDPVILQSAYDLCKLNSPWKYWNVRDVRTLLHVTGINNYELPQGGEHHALYDCYRDLIGIKMAMAKIKKS